MVQAVLHRLPLVQDGAEAPTELLQVGDLARAAHKTVRAIHHYEELGLLTPSARSKGRFRLYELSAVARVRWIGKLHDLGMSLAEIRVVLTGWEAAPSAPGAMAKVRRIYAEKLEETRAQVARLRDLEHELEASLIYLDTFGTAFDTSLSYRGTSCPGTAVVCEDDDCATLQDQIAVVAAPGTHFFAMHTRNSGVTPGPVSLRWQVMPAAAGTNTRITAAGSSAGSSENGYHWTQCVGATRSVSANTCTASYDTVLHVRGPAGEIACDDDTCGSLRSRITAASTSGVGLFQIVVDGYSTSSSGSYTLALTSF